MLSHLGRDLTIRHLVGRFNVYDAPAKAVFFKTFFQFALCFTGTKYQNRLGIANRRNHRIVVHVEMLRKRSLEAILRRYLVRLVGTLKRGITGTAGLFFNFRYYQPHLFPLVRHGHYAGLLMVDPQTHFCFHRFLLSSLNPRRQEGSAGQVSDSQHGSYDPLQFLHRHRLHGHVLSPAAPIVFLVGLSRWPE